MPDSTVFRSPQTARSRSSSGFISPRPSVLSLRFSSRTDWETRRLPLRLCHCRLPNNPVSAAASRSSGSTHVTTLSSALPSSMPSAVPTAPNPWGLVPGPGGALFVGLSSRSVRRLIFHAADWRRHNRTRPRGPGRAHPYAPLSAADVRSTACFGGRNGLRTLFKIDVGGAVLPAPLFNGTDSAGRGMQARDGKIYGVTYRGVPGLRHGLPPESRRHLGTLRAFVGRAAHTRRDRGPGRNPLRYDTVQPLRRWRGVQVSPARQLTVLHEFEPYSDPSDYPAGRWLPL